VYFTCGSLSLWTMPGLKIFAHLYLFFSLACFRAFCNAANSRFWCGDPKLCLLGSLKMLVLALHQIYTNVFHLWKSTDFEQCLGWRFSPISTFFSLVSSGAFGDAPHSRFRCGNPSHCLPNFLKMPNLALPKSAHVHFICGSLSILTVFGWEILAHVNILFSRKFSRV